MEERLAGRRVAGFDHFAHMGLESAQILVAERLRCFVLVDRELLAPGFEAGDAGGELLDAWSAGLLGHGAGLEGAEVALERGVYLAELGVDPLELGLPPGALLVELGEGVLDRLAHDRFLLEGLEEAIEDRLVEALGGEAIGVAACLAVALARLAVEHGFADQAHLAREFRVLGGAAPTEFPFLQDAEQAAA